MKHTVLFVPGFVADTYSGIEQSFVELSAHPDFTVRFLWLVPPISARGNSFKDPTNRTRLLEPLYVPHLRDRGIPYVIGDVARYNVFHNFFLFIRLFREYSIDAVYTHFGHERFWATFFAKLFGKVTIWHEHWHSLGTRFVLAKSIFYRMFFDHVISISEFITSTLPRTMKVHTIPNGINAPKREFDGSERGKIRMELGVDPQQRIVLMVAAFRREKRHELALQVVKGVCAVREDVVFIFLGDGPQRSMFLNAVRGAGLTNSVRAPGHVHNVNDYYAAADLSILTSYFEPFGNCVLESMRFRVPVVAFNKGGPAEIIRDRDYGLLVEEGNTADFTMKVLQLLENDDARRAMGVRAAEVVNRDYSRETWIQRIVDVLRAGII